MNIEQEKELSNIKKLMKEKVKLFRAGDYVASVCKYDSSKFEIIKLCKDAYFTVDYSIFDNTEVPYIKGEGVIVKNNNYARVPSNQRTLLIILENSYWEASKIPYMNTALYKVLFKEDD